METVTKQASEEFDVAVEYYGKLPSNATIESVTASAINNSTQADATGAVLVTDSEVVSGTKAHVRVKGGMTGVTYKVTITVTLSDGQILEDDFLLSIVNV